MRQENLPSPVTRAQWAKHLHTLEKWTICRSATAAEQRQAATNRYFAILKEANLARSIVDCAAFSKAVKAVTSIAKIRLPTIPDFLV
jgi:hypothetical protein